MPRLNCAEEEPSPSKSRKKDEYDSKTNLNACQVVVDNSDSILRVLRNIYIDKLMCDIYLTVGSKDHAAHRLILCASSDVFHAMLMKPEWSEWHESRVVLQELPQCESVFHHFLEYFYTGKIMITHTNVMPILALADKYIVKSLTRLCLTYMSSHVAHAASHNQLFSWLQYTIPCGHIEVAERCRNYIKWNLEAVANTPDFSNFDPEMFIDLLQQNDLVVWNEIVLYNCIVRWMDLQKIKLQQSGLSKNEVDQQITHLIETVMEYIRFPMMTPRELADLLLSPFIKQHKEFFVDRMSIGMLYHSGHEDKIHQLSCTEKNKLLFIPRLYTSDRYNAMLKIENVNSIPSYHTSTIVFSSHLSAAEYQADKIMEWTVDLYPKGVWFKKCCLIVWQGMLEVPEEILRTVRLSLTCQQFHEESMRAHVAILIYGRNGGNDHVMKVIERVHHFNMLDRVLNIDDLIPFDELNPSPVNNNYESPYLTGPNHDQLKLSIIITPTTSICTKMPSSSHITETCSTLA